MSDYIDNRWSGSPAAIAACLDDLGVDSTGPVLYEGHDPRILAVTPIASRRIAGSTVHFITLRCTETLPLPENVFAQEDDVQPQGLFMSLPLVISVRQFLMGMAIDDIITQEEAIAAASTGAVPSFIQTMIDALPEDQAFAAEMSWRAMYQTERYNPILIQLAGSLGYDGPTMDDKFQAWSQL